MQNKIDAALAIAALCCVFEAFFTPYLRLLASITELLTPKLAGRDFTFNADRRKNYFYHGKVLKILRSIELYAVGFRTIPSQADACFYGCAGRFDLIYSIPLT